MIVSLTIEDLRIETYLFDKQTAKQIPFCCLFPHLRLIATWNKQNPSETVKVSDRLLAVNGITQVKENLAEELHLGSVIPKDEDFVKGFTMFYVAPQRFH